MTGFCSCFGWHLVDKSGTVCRGSANGNGWRSRKMLRTQAAAVWLCDRGLDGAQSQSTNSRPVISEQLRQHFAHSWSHQLQEKKQKTKSTKQDSEENVFFFYGDQEEKHSLLKFLSKRSTQSERQPRPCSLQPLGLARLAASVNQAQLEKKKEKKKSQTTSKKCRSSGATRQRRPWSHSALKLTVKTWRAFRQKWILHWSLV